MKAHVADQIGLAEAVRAINNRAVAQVRKDTRTFIEVKGLGRLKKFTGKEEDVQQWSKKTEAFFAGVVKESEIILERSTQQVITMVRAESEFTPPTPNVYGGVVYPEFVLQQTHTHNTCGSRAMRPMTLSPSRGRTRYKHGKDCRND